MCDFTGESQIGLNIHMDRMHKCIPQLYGTSYEIIHKPPNYEMILGKEYTTFKCLEKSGAAYSDKPSLKTHMLWKHKDPDCELTCN